LVWGIGNGLVSTTLVTSIAIDLGAQGLVVSGVVAAPRIAGVLRLGLPALLVALGPWLGGRKGVCLASYALSATTLVVVPLAAYGAALSPQQWRVVGGPLGVLVLAWCVYHVLEYLGTIALWSWLGDLYPERTRSRLLGRRERWLTAGRLVGTAASLGMAVAWPHVVPTIESLVGTPPPAGRWPPLAASAVLGAVGMVLATATLWWMPALGDRPSARPVYPWRSLLGALRERPYRRLMAFSCWFGFANGLTASAQQMFPDRVLGVRYEAKTALDAAMRGGQAAIAPAAGAWIARFGARRVMVLSQLIVAFGPLCYGVATFGPAAWGVACIAMAYILWIAYAPLNVGIDTLKLALADPRNNAPYLAVYHALGDLVNAGTVLLGGLVYDALAAGDGRSLRVYAGLFAAGFVCRLLAVVLAARLDEQPPGDPCRP
jgi:hypothetical protein